MKIFIKIVQICLKSPQFMVCNDVYIHVLYNILIYTYQNHTSIELDNMYKNNSLIKKLFKQVISDISFCYITLTIKSLPIE